MAVASAEAVVTPLPVTPLPVIDMSSINSSIIVSSNTRDSAMEGSPPAPAAGKGIFAGSSSLKEGVPGRASPSRLLRSGSGRGHCDPMSEILKILYSVPEIGVDKFDLTVHRSRRNLCVHGLR